MYCGLILEIVIILLNLNLFICVLKDLGEVIDSKDNADATGEKCLVKPIKGAVPLLQNGTVPLKGGLGIIGGQKASNFDFPHSVIFINYGGVCSGSILSDRLVLTSAHCLDFNKKKKEMTVYSGARFLFDRRADIHKVEDYVIHDRYNIPIRFANDAALLKIQNKFRYRDVVKPAVLVNNKRWMIKGTVVSVAGWGESKPGTSRVSEELKSVNLKLLSQYECKRSAGTSLSPDMFCLWGDEERGSCVGDSGGGALWNNMVVALVSHGGACGQFPGVYTNVIHLRPWITQASKNLNARFARH